MDEFLAATPTPVPEGLDTPRPEVTQTLDIDGRDEALGRREGRAAATAPPPEARRNEHEAEVRSNPEAERNPSSWTRPVDGDDSLVDHLLEQAATEIASLDAPTVADRRAPVAAASELRPGQATAGAESPAPYEPVQANDEARPVRSLDVPPPLPPDARPAAAAAINLPENDSEELFAEPAAPAELIEMTENMVPAEEPGPERRPTGDVQADVELSPLAQTLAHMAEALQADLGVVDEVEELVDAPLTPAPGRSRPPPIPGGGIPEALAERPRRPKRSKPWFEEVFDEDYLRTLPFMTPEQTLREVDFIQASLKVPAGGTVLDIGCGYGRHAIELVQRGLNVTGIDLSLPLLIRAADESQRRAVSVNFVHTDMRELAFDREFDGAYCLLTSFGYFDEETNLRVAEGIARALKPGGRLLIDVINRDYVVSDLPTRLWWEGDGCVVLEEVDFNFNTSRILSRRSVVFEDGRQLEQEISVRAYSLHELGRLIRNAGFRVLEVSGSFPTRGSFFGATSRQIILLAEKRSD